MLLDQTGLAARFDELLSQATALDIAVAWITSAELTDRIVAFAGVPGHLTRIVAGISDCLTSAAALRRLHEADVVRIGAATGNYLFHPKFYLFQVGAQRVCLAGSANLSARAFGGNVELVHEYEDDGAGAAWFNNLWKISNPPDPEWLNDYEKRATNAAALRQPILQMGSPLPPGGLLESWRGYVAELRRADKQWVIKYEGKFGIFTGENTYLGTILRAQPLITKDWSTLSVTDAQILLGLKPEYGLLRSMQAAGTAKNAFLESSPKNLNTRRTIQEELLLLRKVPLDGGFPLMARKVHEVISNRDGFNTGVATRLLALTRPEVLVSVNSESAAQLAQLSGLSEATIRTSLGYERLIKWVMQGKWWNTPAPSDPFESQIWPCRAALIDGIIYQGHYFEANS